MRRTFGIDPERCKKCGSKLKAIAIVEYYQLIQEILESLGITSKLVQLKSFKSRGPPKGTQLE